MSYEEVLVTCLTQAQEAGDLDARHDPRALAALRFITVRGMGALGRARRGRDFMRQVADLSFAFLH